jgi:YebC/PmpR family DNA-binding regulatory protein
MLRRLEIAKLLARTVRRIHCAPVVLAGHSKWANIKHKKGRNDALKAQTNTRFAKLISVALMGELPYLLVSLYSRRQLLIAEGGSTDPATNVRLATALEQAKRNNVPNKVVENAIKRFAEGGGGSQSAVYEGVGPGGAMFVVEVLTDNTTRAVQHVKAAFNKHGGSLSPTLFQFERRGWLVFETRENADQYMEEIYDKIVDLGYEVDGIDVNEDGSVILYTTPRDLARIANAIRSDYPVADMGTEYAPTDTIEVNEQAAVTLEKLVDELEDLDDVSAVYHNIK